MNFYQEITLIPSPEIDLNFLMGKVFHIIHSALAKTADDRGECSFGISFPEYAKDEKQKTLGKTLRIFSEGEEQLEGLKLRKFFCNLYDYVHITRIRRVPIQTVYCCFVRRQIKDSMQAIARRRAKRNKINYSEAMRQLANYQQKVLDFPYIDLISSSNGNKYKIFIEKIKSQERKGSFSTFGLSQTATVPDF